VRLTLKTGVVNRAHAVVTNEHEAIRGVERLVVGRGAERVGQSALIGVRTCRAEVVPRWGSACVMQPLAGAIRRIDACGRHGEAF